MANMSYCMCEHAAKDLQRINEDLHLTEDTSDHEMVAALLLIAHCSEFLLNHAQSIIDFAESSKDEKYCLAVKKAKSALGSIDRFRVERFARNYVR